MNHLQWLTLISTIGISSMDQLHPLDVKLKDEEKSYLENNQVGPVGKTILTYRGLKKLNIKILYLEELMGLTIPAAESYSEIFGNAYMNLGLSRLKRSLLELQKLQTMWGAEDSKYTCSLDNFQEILLRLETGLDQINERANMNGVKHESRRKRGLPDSPRGKCIEIEEEIENPTPTTKLSIHSFPHELIISLSLSGKASPRIRKKIRVEIRNIIFYWFERKYDKKLLCLSQQFELSYGFKKTDYHDESGNFVPEKFFSIINTWMLVTFDITARYPSIKRKCTDFLENIQPPRKYNVYPDDDLDEYVFDPKYLSEARVSCHAPAFGITTNAKKPLKKIQLLDEDEDIEMSEGEDSDFEEDITDMDTIDGSGQGEGSGEGSGQNPLSGTSDKIKTSTGSHRNLLTKGGTSRYHKSVLPYTRPVRSNEIVLSYGKKESLNPNNILATLLAQYRNGQVTGDELDKQAENLLTVSENMRRHFEHLQNSPTGILFNSPFLNCNSMRDRKVAYLNNAFFTPTSTTTEDFIYKTLPICRKYCLQLQDNNFVSPTFPPSEICRITAESSNPQIVFCEKEEQTMPCLKDQLIDKNQCKYDRVDPPTDQSLSIPLVYHCKPGEECNYLGPDGSVQARAFLNGPEHDAVLSGTMDNIISYIHSLDLDFGTVFIIVSMATVFIFEVINLTIKGLKQCCQNTSKKKGIKIKKYKKASNKKKRSKYRIKKVITSPTDPRMIKITPILEKVLIH
jgi:hypothetical protein